MANSLPINSFREEILAAVQNKPATIVVAETGAGKSTQVPQFLLEAGFRVIVTQPRRLAASSLAARVAEERGCRLGAEVGFRTARDREVSSATKLTFVTDGLQLVRELVGAGASGNTVLVLDEVHEWNLNIEVLVAWAKRQVASGANFKVVLMSATLEAEKLAAFFAGAPVISVPGRLFPIEDRRPGRSMAEDVAALVREGRNVLAFQPGKAEIHAFIQELNWRNLDAEILPLHGDLDRAEQARVFGHYRRPKVVVSSPVAQTSVTIDDIDAVVDAGLEKRIEVISGVEGLYLRPVSLADSKQRKGRAGRCKAGIYIDHCPSGQRLDFPKAEILRVRLDQTVLRLAIAGFDMEALEFFHQPSKSEIRRAKESLKALGCIAADGTVTQLGRDVSRLPVSPNIAVMCHAADDHHDPKGTVDLVGDILTIAAILEVGGIVKGERRGEAPAKWRQLTGDEKESDLIAQLNVYRRATELRGEPGKSKGDVLREYNILAKPLFEAQEVRRQLTDALKGQVKFGVRGTREDLLRAICAGMVDHLYKGEYGQYRNGDTAIREIGSESVLKNSLPEWIVGLPFDLEGKNERGRAYRLQLVRLATKVDPAWLCEVAPHLARTESGLNPRFDADKDSVVTTTKIFFRDRLVKEDTILATGHPDSGRLFADWLAAAEPSSYYGGTRVANHLVAVVKENRAVLDEAKSLNHRNGSPLFPTSLVDHYREKLAGAKRQAEVENPETLRFELDPEFAALIRKESPDEIEVNGKSYAVTYSESDPKISISFEERGTVLAFPDEFRLPSGRKVAIACSTHRWYSGHPTLDIPALKVKVRDSLAAEAFEKWEKPGLPLPDLSGIDAAIPELVEASYGDGLTAYNAVVGQAGYHWSFTEPTFSRQWFRDRKEAESARENAAKLLAPVVEKRRKEKEAAERQAELDLQVAAGEALVDFQSNQRRSGVTGNCDAWVIRPDGTRRGSDELYRLSWKVVTREELAIRWYCGTRRDIAGTSQFVVAKLPVDGVTAEQRAAVAKIEEEIGAPKGSFGLDPAANKLRKKILDEVTRVVGRCPACGKQLEWSEMDVTPLMGDGKLFCSCEQADRLKSKAGEPVCIDNSQATLVGTVPAQGGVFEVYRYYKYGCTNLALRFRERETTPKEVKPAAPVDVTEGALDVLSAKWGARRR